MALSAHWKAHFNARQSSGLSQAAYCRQHQLTYATFSARLVSSGRRLNPRHRPPPLNRTVDIDNQRIKHYGEFCDGRSLHEPL